MKSRLDIIREAHAKVLAKQGSFIEELLPSTQEDVLDEAEHLDALDHVEEVDFDSDENEVDMTAVSPEMRGAFA
jgi:hypothetical protein